MHQPATIMNYLRKTIWGLGLILFTILLRVFFDWLFPVASSFNHSLMSVLQAAILLWTIISLLSVQPITGKIIRRNLLIVFLILTLPELVFTYWLNHPSKIPGPLTHVFSQYYDGVQRNIIQFNPGCSVYDSGLFYTLKPSSKFIFDNNEFSDSFYTNKYGLRDDEGSLYKPDIICLGDSYAMGWGVAQNETFAEQLSSLSGKKVLNTAISSYGTARELKSLYRQDTSNLQYIIIQYCRNDNMENDAFIDSGYSLKISPEKEYQSAATVHCWNKSWFPGKHFITISKIYASNKLAKLRLPKNNQPADSSVFYLHRDARNFTDILLKSAINFNKTKVYVIDLNEKELMNNDFLNEVTMLTHMYPYKLHFNDNLIMVPVADILGDDDYYILDTHLLPSGHRKIAERLYSYIFSGK